jgi:hypothetical protein
LFRWGNNLPPIAQPDRGRRQLFAFRKNIPGILPPDEGACAVFRGGSPGARLVESDLAPCRDTGNKTCPTD